MVDGNDALKRLKEIKEQFEGSNKYMLTIGYEDIKDLFVIIEILNSVIEHNQYYRKIEQPISITDIVEILNKVSSKCDDLEEKLNNIEKCEKHT